MGSNTKPPEFDGKSSFHDFLVQFELISEMNGWDRLSMATELAACLHGPAVAVLSDLEPFQRKISMTWCSFEPENQTNFIGHN